MIRSFVIAGIALASFVAPRLPAQEIETGTTKFEVAGVRVILRHTNNNLVVANLYLLGGVRVHTAQNAGLEPMLLEVTERGTAKYPGEELRRAMARSGLSSIVITSEAWTMDTLG